MFLAFILISIINEPLQLYLWNITGWWIIYIHTHSKWKVFYILAVDYTISDKFNVITGNVNMEKFPERDQ
jgi:hypothetical protein